MAQVTHIENILVFQADKMLQYLTDHLTWLASLLQPDGNFHKCKYKGCEKQTRLRYCDEHYHLHKKFVEKYHIWNRYIRDSKSPKTAEMKRMVARTELILRDRYEYLFSIEPDRKHAKHREDLVVYITAEDIEEIISYAKKQNEGRNLEYWEEQLKRKRETESTAK